MNSDTTPSLNPDAAVPDQPLAPTVMIADTLGTPGAVEVSADDERQAAYHAIHSLNGRALNRYSYGRQVLFKLCRRFLPLGGLKLPETYSPEFQADAVLLLYLCDCPDSELRTIRHSADLILDKSFEWADVHLQAVDPNVAGELAFTILRQAEINIAVPQPSGRTAREGN